MDIFDREIRLYINLLFLDDKSLTDLYIIKEMNPTYIGFISFISRFINV